MKFVFFIKMNNKVTKVFEEEQPADVPPGIKEAMGVVAIKTVYDPLPVKRTVIFKRFDSPGIEDALFMFDVDAFELSRKNNTQNL